MSSGVSGAPALRIYRHPAAVRLWHWMSVVAVGGLLFTGFNILNIHPRLYWGEVGNISTRPIIAIESTQAGGPNPATSPAPAAFRIGSRTWDVTGHLGAVLDAGGDGLYFIIVTTPDSWHFGAMRAWHFAAAWALFLSWLGYVGYLFLGGRFARMLLPSREQVTARAIIFDLWDHLRLRRPRGDQAREYNLLQKLAYLIVLFVLIPLLVLTGIAMSNGVTARIPELYSVFGGRQSARTIHALCAMAMSLFILIHVAQVFVAGFINELRSMVTGYFEVRREVN